MFKRYLTRLYHRYMSWHYECRAEEASFYGDDAKANYYFIKSGYHDYKGKRIKINDK